MLRVAVGDVVEQLAGGFERGFRARNAEAVVLELPARLALHAGEGLAQAGGRLQRAFAQRGGDGTGDPQHAPRLVLLGAHEQRIDGGAELAGNLGRTVLRPLRAGRGQNSAERAAGTESARTRKSQWWRLH